MQIHHVQALYTFTYSMISA